MNRRIKLSQLPKVSDITEINDDDLIMVSRKNKSLPEEYVSNKITYKNIVDSLIRDLYFTITLDSNGGICAYSKAYAFKGHPIGQLPLARMPGKEFIGWYTLPFDGEMVNRNFIAQEDSILYAHYEDPSDLQ